MPLKIHRYALVGMLVLASGMAASFSAYAAPHELRIYADDIPQQDEAEIELIMSVAKPKASPDGPQNRVMQTLIEYGYGLGSGWSVGLELPFSNVQGRNKVEGLKAEVQYVAEHNKADGWYWGVRSDLGYASSPYEAQGGNSLEINPILGFRLAKWHAIVNPSLEKPLSGRASKAQFLPSAKIARQLSESCQLGLEYFSDWGAVNKVLPKRQRDESLYLVWDEKLSAKRMNFGLGKPLNPHGGSADRWVIKVGLTVDVD